MKVPKRYRVAALSPSQCLPIQFDCITNQSAAGPFGLVNICAVSLSELFSQIKLFGGVTMFTEEQFRRVNGFSNYYWGWGGEDDDMYNRLINKGECLLLRATMITANHVILLVYVFLII